MKKLLLVILTLSTSSLFSQNLIQPEHLEYLGAFLLPGDNEERGWSYTTGGYTFYPAGDPQGPQDGYPGSLFGIGHTWYGDVSEVSIPVPLISATKDITQLNTAATLQDFANIREQVFDDMYFEITRCGIEYLPAQGSQSGGKLYMTYGQHYQEDSLFSSFIWLDLDLSNPNLAGPWHFGNYSNYRTDDYIFEIPQQWSDTHTPGLRLAAGRVRDGGWGGYGPNIFAFGPWNDGNPPAPYDTLRNITPLLMYDSFSEDPNPHKMNTHHMSDQWFGGAWLTSGNYSSIAFIVMKGQGECWYGLPDGTVWPDEPPYPEDPENQRGWWSDSFEAMIYLYNPDDLAKVAAGTMELYGPQPYAMMNISDRLFLRDSVKQKYLLDGIAYDRANNIIYISEPFGAGDGRPVMHAWKVTTPMSADENNDAAEIFKADYIPECECIRIGFGGEIKIPATVEVFNLNGGLAGTYSIENPDFGNSFDIAASGLTPGVYIIRLNNSGRLYAGRINVIK